MSGKSSGRLTRRRLLAYGGTGAGLVLGSGLLAACAPPAPTPAPAKPAELPKPAGPTPTPVIVEKIVEKERVVQQTVVVEKVVTPTPAPKPQAAPRTERAKSLILDGGVEPNQGAENRNFYAVGNSQIAIYQGMAESLFYLRFDTGEFVPWLAESYQFGDKYDELTIKLRKGITWSDGKPLTSADAVFTFNMLRDGSAKLGGYGVEMAKWVKEAKAVDEQTFKLTFTGPYPRFILQNLSVRLVSAVQIMPKHVWEKEDPVTFKNYDPGKGYPIYTGPYKMIKSTPQETIVERRPDWWGYKTGFWPTMPEPERIVMPVTGPPEKRAAMIEADQIDYTPLSTDVPLFIKIKSKNPALIGWKADVPNTWRDPCPWIVGINCQREPWSDPQMRWAVIWAIDKAKLSNTVNAGFGEPTNFIFPDYPAAQKLLAPNKDLLEKYNFQEYSVEKAQKAIESKGWKRGGDGIYAKDGKRLAPEMIATSAAITTAYPTLVASYLRQAGIDASVKMLSSTAYWDRKNTNDFDLECTWTYCGTIVDPYASMQGFHSRYIQPPGQRRAANQWGFSNKEYDGLIEEMALYPPGHAKTAETFRKALEIWLPNAPIFPTDQSPRALVFNSRYWTNWPTEANRIWDPPPPWWMSFFQTVLRLKPSV